MENICIKDTLNQDISGKKQSYKLSLFLRDNFNYSM